jgi:hypothetical protein
MSRPAQESTGNGLSPSAIVLGILVAAFAVWHFTGSDPGVDLTRLTSATTDSRLQGAPPDPHPQRATDGVVVHPKQHTAVYDAPGGSPVGQVGPRQFGPTWLPVIDTAGDWVRVLLPSRPNGSTGWLAAGDVQQRSTSYLVRVHLGSRTLEVLDDGVSLGSWPVAVGAPGTPTPVGRTFLLGSITDSDQGWSPVILPLGAHSDTLDTYGGGPGTAALHGWPDSSVFGAAVSHGCVRVPADALDLLTEVPLGTLVIIDRS